MDYKELIEQLRAHERNCGYGGHCILCKCLSAIETLLAERDAAVEDLTKICEENPDVCEYCKHMPCAEKYERCIGWEWRGPQKGDGHGDLPPL